MTLEFTLSERDRRIQVTASGPIDIDESLATGATLMERADFQPDFGVFVDAREIDFSPSAIEIEQLGRTLGQFKERFLGRIAVLVQGTLMFGIMRMICSVAEANGFPMRPFTDFEEASAWLEAEPT